MNRRHTFLLLLVVLLAAFVFLVNSTSGLGLMLRFVPGRFETELVSGTLARGFVLENTHYENNGYLIDVRHFALDWRLWPLLINRVNIESITLDGVSITIPDSPADSPATEPAFPALPLMISISDLQVSNLNVMTPGRSEPVHIDKIQLRAHNEQQQLYLETFSVSSPDYQFRLAGEIRLDARLAHTLSADWAYQHDDALQFAGTASLAGDLRHTEGSVPVTSPAQADIKFSLDTPVEDLFWSATAVLPGFDPSVYGDLPAQKFDLQLNASGTKEDAEAKGSLRLVGPAPAGSLQAYRFENLDADFTIAAQQLRSGAPELTGTIGWRELRVLIGAAPASVQFDNGQLQFQYENDRLQFDSESDFNLNSMMTGRWRIGGNADAESVLLETLRLDLPQGSIEGQFSLRDIPASRRIQTRLRWDRLDVSLPSGQSAVLAAGSFELSGAQDDYEARFTSGINIDNLPSAQLAVSASGNQTLAKFDAIELALLDGRILGTGTIDRTENLRAAFRFNGTGLNPGSYWPDWPGLLALNADLQMQAGEQLSLQVHRLTLHGELREHPISLDLPSAYRNNEWIIRQARLAIASTTMQVDGTVGKTASRLEWKLDSPELSQLDPRLTGRVEGSGELSGSLQQPALSALLSAGDIRSPWGELGQMQGRFTLDDRIDVDLRLQQLTLAGRMFESVVLNVAGTAAEHDYRLDVAKDGFHLLAEGQAGYADANWRTVFDRLAVIPEKPDSGWPADGLQAGHASLSLSGLDNLTADYTALGLDGRLDWELDNLSFLDGLGLPVTDINGELDVDMSVTGQVAAPVLSGNLSLTNSAFIVPALGINVEEMNINGNADPDGSYRVTGRLRSGDGQLGIQTDISTADGLALSGAVQGTHVEVIHVPEIRAWASPDIRLSFGEDRSRFEGRIIIPEATINLNEFRDTVKLSEDVVLSNQEASKPREVQIDTDIELQFGDRIVIQGQGLSGRLTGKLDVRSNERGQLIGNGEVAIVEGKFSAYGQSLLIEQGRLVFSNSLLNNPELRITAVRRIDDEITAGIRVGGYASNPSVTLFSTPVMSDDEILAYIVFGRPLSSLTSGEGTDLIGAATAMGLQNTGFLTRRISSTFGLDQLQITSDASGENASVEIGKYLTPKLYISYAMGLFEQIATAQIRYDLNRNWSVEVKSSTDVGADLYYKIQK